MSSVRDRYDRDTLNALQSIARSLDRIANVMESKSEDESGDVSSVEKLTKKIEAGDLAW